MTAACPACRRPVAMARPLCVYCGARLPPEALAAVPGRGAALPAAPAPDTPAPRALVLVDLGRTAPADLARALGLAPYEADLKARRGGFHLHRVLAAAESEREAAALAALGLDVLVLPEDEVRAAPVTATGGGPEEGRLRLRTGTGEERLAPEDLLIVVRGPIAREYQTAAAGGRRLPTASLAAGARVHLHRRLSGGPVEIDPAEFVFGADASVRGAERTVASWIATLFAGVPVDDGFRWTAPALAPALPPASAALPGPARPGKDTRVVLDNLAQFRFYSGVRAAVERRRRG